MLITQTLVFNILEFDYVIDVVDIGSDYVTLCSIVYDVSFLVWTCISGNNDDILLLLYAKILMWYFVDASILYKSCDVLTPCVNWSLATMILNTQSFF